VAGSLLSGARSLTDAASIADDGVNCIDPTPAKNTSTDSTTIKKWLSGRGRELGVVGSQQARGSLEEVGLEDAPDDAEELTVADVVPGCGYGLDAVHGRSLEGEAVMNLRLSSDRDAVHRRFGQMR